MAIPRTLVIVLWSSIVEDSILVGAEETENGLRIASDGGLRTRGAISNRRRSLATCQTLEVVGGDSPGLYTQDGTSNEAGIFFNEGRSSVMYFRLRGEEDDDDAPEDDDTEDDDTEDDDTEDDDTEDDDTEDDDTEDDDTEDGDTEDDDTEDDDTEDGDTQDDDTEDDDTEDGDPEDDDTQDDDTRDDDTEDDDTEDDDPEDDDTEDDDTENDDTQDDDTEDDDNQDDDTQDDDTEDDNNRRWRRGLSAGGFVRRTRARRLGACVSGYWTIGPVGGGYPQLMVDDCASNPADIKVDEWYIRYCAECDTVDYHGQDPVVDCASSASPPPSSLSPSLTPSTGPATAPALTPSPSFITLSPSTFSVTASPSPSSTSIAGSTSPSSLTLSPSSMTPSPLALTPSPSIPTSVSSPSSSSSVSTPAPSEGELAVEDDDTEDDDVDDDEDDDVDNAEDDDGPSEDFVVQTPSPVVGEGGCRVLDVEGLYAGLYRRIGTYNNRGDYYTEDLAYNIFFATADETEDTSTSSEANGNDRRTLLSARSPLLDLDKTIHSRGLEECDAGYWIITSTGGGYPFLAVPDCAVNPENIGDSSSWVEIACDGCDATDPSESPTVECATGGDALVPTPSPVAPVGGFSGVGSSLPGGVSTCEEVTVTGARIGEYTVVGEVNDRVELQSSDGDYHIYWGSPAPGLQDRRRRRLSEDSDMEFSGRQGQHGQRGLQSCDGYWYIAPATDLYPAYAVLDCAYHPADITATDWLFLDCEDCDVQNAVPRPDVSCTGAGPNIKRGAPTFDTPAPTVFNVNATIEPDTGVHSTCRSLIVTGDFSGNYTAEGRYRGKLDFFSSDGQFNLYFELAANSRRALQSLAAAAGLSQAEDGVMSEEGQTEWRESEESEGGSLEARRASAIDDMGAALNQVLESRESLAACTAGYWILARVSGDPYPVFGVADCAEHPVDIRAATWLVVTCQSCSVQEAPSFVKPTIACGDGESSLTTSGGTVDPTPAPALPASCNRVYVTGPAPGIYDQRGTQGDRGDFFSVGRLYNLYWVFYAGKPVNRGRRYRKVLSEAEGVSPQKWSEDIGEVRGTSAQGHRSDANLVGSNRDSNSERRLEFCEDGFWLITPRGGGFPFYGTKNCAMHPADIAGDATWNTVQCEGCGSESMNDTISISCNSANYIPQPTPTPSLASGQSPTSDPGSDTLVETSTGVTRGGLRWQTGLVFRPALLAFLSSILMAWVL